MPNRIYLDHNATTPLHPAALDAMMPYLGEAYGNPSSVHWLGQQARRAVDLAREQVAALVAAHPDEVVFVSGGTEANHLALHGVIRAARTYRQQSTPLRFVTSAVEHSSVLQACVALVDDGVDVAVSGVDGRGIVDVEEVVALANRDAALVSLMLANNDMGILQPVAQVAARVRACGALVHSDAVQALGKLPLDVAALGVDLLSLSAHKVGGPKGVGALVVRRGTSVAPVLRGGGQEQRRRAGTENVAGIVGFGAACAVAASELDQRVATMMALRDRLEQRLLATVPGVVVHGAGAARLPNTLSVRFAGVDGAALLKNLDLEGIAASVGSACSSGRAEPSHVLLAMGCSPDQARSALRLSLGPTTSEDDVELVATTIASIVARLSRSC